MHHYIKPEVPCIDELGYLPIDKFGADCLFQILSHRYESGATLVTTSRIYKQWAGIFNNATRSSPQHGWIACCTTAKLYSSPARAVAQRIRSRFDGLPSLRPKMPENAVCGPKIHPQFQTGRIHACWHRRPQHWKDKATQQRHG